ncbi:hypothetical protein EMIT079MI2_40205 [Bacillus sp. IT-79MI2]
MKVNYLFLSLEINIKKQKGKRFLFGLNVKVIICIYLEGMSD